MTRSLLLLALAILALAALPPTPIRAAEAAKKADRKNAGPEHPVMTEPDWTVREYGHHDRPHEFNASMALWPNSFGLAVWYDVPILPDGFIHGVNDSVDLEFGALIAAFRSAYYWNRAAGLTRTDYGIIPAGGLRWNFHLTRDWTPFAALKVGALVGLTPDYSPAWFVLGFSLGTHFRIRDDMWLRLELGSLSNLSLGLTFPIGG